MKIFRFCKAVIKWALSGFKLSNLHDKRMETCFVCTHYNKGRCDICGCVLRAKTRMFTEECPIKKW